MPRQRLSFIDRCLVELDQALRTCTVGAGQPARRSPAELVTDNDLSESERNHSAALMRVNHTGEVCAQALYAGQARTAQLGAVRATMEQAAAEEADHLAWCEQRLGDLGSRPSHLNPIFYGLSFSVGALAGLAGDRWSLGFVAETERQVCEHLQEHLAKLPERDHRSQAVLQQMIIDEQQHGETASKAGGAPLPMPVRKAMSLLSQVMKTTTYRL